MILVPARVSLQTCQTDAKMHSLINHMQNMFLVSREYIKIYGVVEIYSIIP